MNAVRLTFPPVVSPGSVAEAVLSAAFLLLGRAELGDRAADEACLELHWLSKAVRHGRTERTIAASREGLLAIASACRQRAGEFHDGHVATPVLLTIALGCEAGARTKAA